MLGRCGKDQLAAKTMGASLRENRATGVLSNLVHSDIQTHKREFLGVSFVWFGLFQCSEVSNYISK